MRELKLKPGASGMEALLYESKTPDSGRMMIYLHGKAGFEAGIPGLFQYPDLAGLLCDGMTFGENVLFPVCTSGDRWDAAVVAAFLADFEQQQGARTATYDIAGYSRGGTGAYELAAYLGEKTRSVLAIAARPAMDVVPSLLKVPVLIAHGLHDAVVPPEDAQTMNAALNSAGGCSALWELEGDHYIADRVFSSARVHEWLGFGSISLTGRAQAESFR